MGAEKEISKRTKIILICAVLIFTFIWVYRPHFDYQYPLHVDEWAGINEARRIQEKGYVNAEHEIGFFLFLAGLNQISNLVLIYKFLPAIIACISALTLFFLVSRKTNFYTGLFAMLFFATLPSNLNILGVQFLTAITFSFPFMFLFALFFTEGYEELNIRKLALSALMLTLMAFIHPPMTMLIFAVSIVYLLANYNKTKKVAVSIIQKRPWFLIFPAIAIVWMFYFLWKGNIFSTLANIFSKLTFEIGYTHYQVNYFLPALYGGIASAFAIIGLWKGMHKKKFLFFNCWLSVAFVLLLIFIFFKISFLASYQRIIYFSFLSLLPFSALGANYFVNKSKKYVKPVFVAMLIIFALFYFHYNPSDELTPFHLIDETKYETMEFLSTLNKSMLMAPVEQSLPLYYLTGQETIVCPTYYTCLESQSVTDSVVFYSDMLNCSEKKNILEKYQIRYVWSQKPIDCDFKKIFENGDYVYEFEKFSNVHSPAECEYNGQFIDCVTEEGKSGRQMCFISNGWKKLLGECKPYECNYERELIDCTTEEGQQGIQKCLDYKGYGTILGKCLPKECNKPGELIDCTTTQGTPGKQKCQDYKNHGKILQECKPYECNKPGELINCTTENGKPGTQKCLDYKGYGKILQECKLYECNYAGELVNCTTKEGQQGIQRCQNYKGYGKTLQECKPYECNKPEELIDCTTENGQQGVQNCRIIQGYGTILGDCLPKECNKPGELIDCTTTQGTPGKQRCQDYKGYGKTLQECLPKECNYTGQLIDCTTENGQQGTQKCLDYKGYGKTLGKCNKLN